MRKTTFLLTLLLGLLFSVGAWAQAVTVTVNDGRLAPDTYGTKSLGTTFTSNAASGLAGLTITAAVLDWHSVWYGSCLVVKPSAGNADENVTITAPTGYKIVAYDINFRAAGSACTYKVTVDGTQKDIVTGTNTGFTANNINANSTTFTIHANSETLNWLCITGMSVIVVPDGKSVTTEAWTLFPTTGKNAGNYNYVKVTTPSTQDYYTMDFFDLWTSTGGDNNAAYLIVSEKPYSNSFSLTKNEVLAVSRNNPYMYTGSYDQLATRYFFDKPVLLKGGTVYYLYFATGLAANSTDTYTLVSQRIAAYGNGGATDNLLETNFGPQYSTILTAVDAPAVTDMEGNELSESKYYRIALPGRAGIVAMTQNGDNVNPQTWSGDATQIWKVKKDGAGYKITAAQDGDNKFWKEVEFVEGNTKVTATSTEAEARTWTISKVSTLNNTYNITADNGSGTTYYFSNHGGGTNNMGFYNSNTGYDGGSLFTFTAVDQSNYVCQTPAGTVLRSGAAFVSATTESAPAISGWTISSVTDGDPIVFKYTNAAATTFAANITSSPAPTLNGSTYEFANGTAWYAFRMHNAGTYWLKDNGAGGVTGADTYDIDNNDNLWCFVGSLTDGYKIYNRNGKALSVTAGGNAVLGSDPATTFDVFPSTAADGKPCFWILGAASGTSSYLNYNSGAASLATYTDSDNGSTLFAIVYPLEAVFAYAGAPANNVGSLSNQADFNTAISAYALAQSESNLDAVIAAYKAGTPIEFVDGQTYFVVSRGNSAKLASTTDGARLTHTAISANPAYTYWKLKKVGDNFTLQNLANGKYVSIPGTESVTTIAMSDEAVNLAIAASTALNYKTVATATTADKLLNQAATTTTFTDGVTVWHGSENANQWRFEVVNPATLTMLNPDAIAASNAVGEADVYMSYANATGADVQLPDDVTVYKVEAGGSIDEVTMTEVDTRVVPNGAGVVVKAKNGVEIPLLATSTTEDLTGNVLVPGTGSAVDGFILAYKRGETTPKFYKMSSLTLGADKAYLPSTYFGSSVQAVSLNFGGLTGIESAQTEAQQDGQIFDLQGRRVEKAQKGLYIVNGKKVLVK